MTAQPDNTIDSEVTELLEDAIHAGYVGGYNEMAQNFQAAPYNHMEPRPIDDIKQAITNLIAQEANKAVVAELNRLHRYDGKDYDTELDEIIDNRIEELTADKEQA